MALPTLGFKAAPAAPPRIAPRVCTADGCTARVEVAVGEALARGARYVGIVGPPGSGKTTALGVAHRAVAGRAVGFIDDETRSVVRRPLADGVRAVVFTLGAVTFTSEDTADVAWLRLAPWGADECVEWAIGEPRETRRSFVDRAMRVMEGGGEGNAEVLSAAWRAVARHPDAVDFPSAIMNALADSGVDTGPYSADSRLAMLTCVVGVGGTLEGAALRGLLRHRAVLQVLGVARVVRTLSEGKPADLALPLTPETLASVGLALPTAGRAVDALTAELRRAPAHPWSANMATALSIAGVPWRPEGPLDLAEAGLAGAAWTGLTAAGLTVSAADLTGADLSDAELTGLRGDGARFAHADLSRVRLPGAHLERAGLRGANLRWAELGGAQLDLAGLADADLTGAVLAGAHLHAASLAGARLVGADLSGAALIACGMEGADLTGACATGAQLERLDLRGAALDALLLDSAKVSGCRFAGVAAAGVRGEYAVFSSCDFTGSVLRRLSLPGATLEGCGLADVWWPGADLRCADFTGSTFHMGSSRSGLVGSPIACEGSRTGFYTDEALEQGYRPPEEIAKADLRGADLRGAVVEGTDWYLVDLRGAKYEPEQAEWFRRCRAILRDPRG